MVGFDFVKTRTLAYVQSFDWLPIIVQFSKICCHFEVLFKSAPSTGDLIIISCSHIHVNTFLQSFSFFISHSLGETKKRNHPSINNIFILGYFLQSVCDCIAIIVYFTHVMQALFIKLSIFHYSLRNRISPPWFLILNCVQCI